MRPLRVAPRCAARCAAKRVEVVARRAGSRNRHVRGTPARCSRSARSRPRLTARKRSVSRSTIHIGTGCASNRPRKRSSLRCIARAMRSFSRAALSWLANVIDQQRAAGQHRDDQQQHRAARTALRRTDRAPSIVALSHARAHERRVHHRRACWSSPSVHERGIGPVARRLRRRGAFAPLEARRRRRGCMLGGARARARRRRPCMPGSIASCARRLLSSASRWRFARLRGRRAGSASPVASKRPSAASASPSAAAVGVEIAHQAHRAQRARVGVALRRRSARRRRTRSRRARRRRRRY